MNKVKEVVENKVQEMCEIFLDAPFGDLNFYKLWMNQHYYIVQHSTRYLAYCASKVCVENDTEFYWWAHHLEEEMGHNRVLLKDIKNAGVSNLKAKQVETQAIISALYKEVDNNGPHVLLGYILLLEGVSAKACDKLAKIVEEKHGRGVTSFLKMHGSVDQEHYKEGIDRLNEMSLKQQEEILNNLELSFYLYSNFMRSLVEQTQTELLDIKIAA